jgi:UDP-N-acetylmuramate dehydrogenase
MKNNGKKIVIENDELEFSYRESNILDNDIVVGAAFNVELGDKKEIKEELKIIKNNRESSQPIKTKTSGSSFKNPTGVHAAELIDLAGCKDLKVGDAVVSSKHANFLINTNNATAAQIEDLGKLIIEKVYNKFQIVLDWEIKIVGDPY